MLFLIPGLCCYGSSVDSWKDAAGDYLGKVKDYSGYIKFIESGEYRERDYKSRILLLAWLYCRVEDKVNEKRCITRYFQDTKGQVELGFLDSISRIRVHEFMVSWKKNYPSEVSVKLNRNRYPYNEGKVVLRFRVKTTASAELQVFVDGRSAGKVFFLQKGDNSVNVEMPHFKVPEKNINFRFKTDRIEFNRDVPVRRRVVMPDNILVNWKTSEISLAGRSYRKEFRYETEIVQEKYFDKRRFFRKALPHFIVGAGLIGVNRFVIDRRLDNRNISGGNRAFMEGAGGTTMVLGAGLSVKGVVEFIKSFRKKVRKVSRRVVIDDAVEHNRLLKGLITDASSKIFLEYSSEAVQ